MLKYMKLIGIKGFLTNQIICQTYIAVLSGKQEHVSNTIHKKTCLYS